MSLGEDDRETLDFWGSLGETSLVRRLEQVRGCRARLSLVEVRWKDEEWEELRGFLETEEAFDSIEIVARDYKPRIPSWGTAQELSFRHSSFRDASAECLFGTRPPLRRLSLVNCAVGPGVAVALASLLSGKDCLLEVLDCTETRFLEGTTSHIAKGLRCNHSLRKLCLSECNLHDRDLACLVRGLWDACGRSAPGVLEPGHGDEPPSSSEWHPLEELDLSFNKGQSETILALASLLKDKASRLRTLNMGFQAFGVGKDVVEFASFFEAAFGRADPAKIVLQRRILSFPETQPLPSPINGGSHLVNLDLGGNGLRLPDLKCLVDALLGHPVLESLDLAQNRFANPGVAYLSSRLLHTLPSLRYLSLEDIRGLSRVAIKALYDALVAGPNHPCSERIVSTNAWCSDSGNRPFVGLRELEVSESLQAGSVWADLAYQLDLNWAGRFCLLGTKYLPTDSTICTPLWPRILARANQRTRASASLVYYLILQHGPLFLPTKCL